MTEKRRVVAITGAGGALGAALSSQFAGEDDTDLVLSDVSGDSLEATVSVAGGAARPTTHGREVSWTATRGGGLSLYVKYTRGWVIYSARLALR